MIFLVGLKLNLSFLCAYWIVNLTCFVGCFWKWTDAFLIDTRTMVHRIRNWRFLWLVLRRVMECSSQRYCLLLHILCCFETLFFFFSFSTSFGFVADIVCMCCLASGWLGNWWIHGTSCFKGNHRRSWGCWQCWSKCVQTLS